MDINTKRARWIKQIGFDTDLSASAAKLGIVLAEYVNRDSEVAWPSVERLAKDLGITESSIRNATKKLVKCGHLKVEGSRGGRRTTNRYFWILMDENPPKNLQGKEGEKPPKNLSETPQYFEQKPLKNLGVNLSEGNYLNKLSDRGGDPPTPHCGEEDTDASDDATAGSAEDPRPLDGEILGSEEAAFGEFWEAYPKQEDKEAARRAWSRAIKEERPEVIIAAAEAYARYCKADQLQRKYIKFPKNWLLEYKWKTEWDAQAAAASPRMNGSGSRGNCALQQQQRPSQSDQMMEIFTACMEASR